MLKTMINEQVSRAYNHLVARLSKTITYRRLKEIKYDPEEGETKVFWEEVEIKSILISASERARKMQGGLLQDGDLVAALRKDAFTKQDGETEDPVPKLGDEVEIDGVIWGLDLGGKIFLEKDPTEQVFFVGLRRAQT